MHSEQLSIYPSFFFESLIIGLPLRRPLSLRSEPQDVVQSSRESGDKFKTEIENQYFHSLDCFRIIHINQPPLVLFSLFCLQAFASRVRQPPVKCKLDCRYCKIKNSEDSNIA